MQKPIRTLFYIEALFNSLTAVTAILLPDLFLSMYAPSMPAEPLSEAFIRWFGVMLVPLTFILVKALRNGSLEMLKPVVQGMLIGDVLFAAAIWMLADTLGEWTATTIATLIFVIFIATVRVYALWARPDLLAQLHPAGWGQRARNTHKRP